MSKFSDVYIYVDNDMMYCVMGTYKGIRLLIKVFASMDEAKNYIEEGRL